MYQDAAHVDMWRIHENTEAERRAKAYALCIKYYVHGWLLQRKPKPLWECTVSCVCNIEVSVLKDTSTIDLLW